MKIFVRAKAGARENRVTAPGMKLFQTEEMGDEYYTVSVKERAVEGRANDAIIRLLAEHFGVSWSAVRLVSGSTSKRKVFEILN